MIILQNWLIPSFEIDALIITKFKINIGKYYFLISAPAQPVVTTTGKMLIKIVIFRILTSYEWKIEKINK